MKIGSTLCKAALGCITAVIAQSALAADVLVTPLGGQEGEFCPQDRALIFEDPNGTRILYDAGRTVAGADDPRLGKIDIILVSHMHGDHLGNTHAKAPNSGTCDKPDVSVSALPNSVSVNIAPAKKAKIVTGSEMPPFFANKLGANGGDPEDSILARFGGSTRVGGVTIATVTALHSNGLDPDYIGGELGRSMKEAGIAGYVGEATGPKEAAYVIGDLVKPNAVIVSHANEVATKGGKVIPGTRTDAFIKAVTLPVHVPLSGRTMSFDSAGKCVSGC